jgi:hypothetical protein
MTALCGALLMNASEDNRIIDPLIEAYKKDVDRTLIRENLRLSVEERFEKLMRLHAFADELRRSGKQREQRS